MVGMWGWWRGHVSVAMGTLSAGGAGVGEQTARCGERLPQPHEPRRGRNSAVSDAVDLVRHATSAGPTACHRLRAVTSLPAASGDNPSPPRTRLPAPAPLANRVSYCSWTGAVLASRVRSSVSDWHQRCVQSLSERQLRLK